MIRISVKDFAKFVMSGAAGQRSILRKYKLASPEGKAQMKYYSEARRAIREYLASGNDNAVSAKAVARIQSKVSSAPSPRTAAKLERNIRAFESYMRNFGRYRFEVLPNVPLHLVDGDVLIGATPDLHVKANGREVLMKLDFGVKPPKAEGIDIVSQVIHEAARASCLQVNAEDVIYLDVIRGTIHRRAAARSALSAEIRSACRGIEELWSQVHG